MVFEGGILDYWVQNSADMKGKSMRWPPTKSVTGATASSFPYHLTLAMWPTTSSKSTKLLLSFQNKVLLMTSPSFYTHRFNMSISVRVNYTSRKWKKDHSSCLPSLTPKLINCEIIVNGPLQCLISLLPLQLQCKAPSPGASVQAMSQTLS